MLLLLIDGCWTILLKTGIKKWKMFILLDVLVAVKYLTLVVWVQVIQATWMAKNIVNGHHLILIQKSFFNKPRTSDGSFTVFPLVQVYVPHLHLITLVL